MREPLLELDGVDPVLHAPEVHAPERGEDLRESAGGWVGWACPWMGGWGGMRGRRAAAGGGWHTCDLKRGTPPKKKSSERVRKNVE